MAAATKRKVWSGIRESNPRLDLGKVAYYHYTNPAHGKMCDVFIYSMGPTRGQGLAPRVFKHLTGLADLSAMMSCQLRARPLL